MVDCATAGECQLDRKIRPRSPRSGSLALVFALLAVSPTHGASPPSSGSRPLQRGRQQCVPGKWRPFPVCRRAADLHPPPTCERTVLSGGVPFRTHPSPLLLRLPLTTVLDAKTCRVSLRLGSAILLPLRVDAPWVDFRSPALRYMREGEDNKRYHSRLSSAGFSLSTQMPVPASTSQLDPRPHNAIRRPAPN